MDIKQLATVEVHPTSMTTEVTSVSRTSEPIGRSPAAVYVVTNEMIRRSGARNIPEVLRTVPEVQVSRINASAWAISIRGFNSRFSNKLLVQVDGVAIYSPTHSGVFWEREYVMLEDVDRIEVVRGSGASVWGVNAVNGIINIITKSSKDTKGIYVDGGGGDLHGHRQFGDFRVGGQSGNLQWRAYGITMGDGLGYAVPPAVAFDNPNAEQGGFRTDWTPTSQDTFTIQGDFYSGIDNQTGTYTPPAAPVASMNCKTSRIMTRWARKIDDETDWALQFYYYNPYATGQNLNVDATFDSDFQYHMQRNRHDIVWGLGYRNNQEKWVGNQGTININQSEQIPNYFLQDTITLVDDQWFLTLGSKFDHDSVSTFDYQPTGRIVWTPNDKTSIWSAITRSVCTPSLVQRMIFTPKPENCMSYEIGMRQQSTERYFWELATFFSRYEDLMEYNGKNYVPDNDGRGDTYGFGYNATYNVTQQWRLTGYYAFLVETLKYTPGLTPYVMPGLSARNLAYLQSGWDLSDNVTLDLMLRYVDSLAVGVNSYFAGDVRLGWRLTKRIELAAVGQNLLAGKHYESVTNNASNPTMIGPAVYGMVSWRY